MNAVVTLRSDQSRTRRADVSIVNEPADRVSVGSECTRSFELITFSTDRESFVSSNVDTCRLFFEVYTSLAYSGPPLVKKLNRELAAMLK